MNKKRKPGSKVVRNLAAVTVAALVVPLSPVRALEFGSPGEGIGFQNIYFHPTLGLSGYYRSNIHIREEDPVGDYVLRISPGFTLDIPWRPAEFRGLYRADIYRHDRYRDQDRVHHLADGTADIWLSDFGLRFRNRFSRASTIWETEFFERLFRDDNTATITALGFFNRLQIEAGYRNFRRRFQQVEYHPADRMEHQGLFTGYYRVSPKIRALVKYTYNSIEYRITPTRDGQFHEIQAGVRGNIAPRLVGVVRAGWQERRYDQPELEDYSGLVGYISLEHKYSQNTEFELGWEGTPRESIYAGNSYYLINRFWLRWNQQLTNKLLARPELLYYHHRYPATVEIEGESKRRTDITWQAGGRLSYQVQQWLEAALSYHYRNRDSNISGLSYEDHIVTVGVSAYY